MSEEIASADSLLRENADLRRQLAEAQQRIAVMKDALTQAKQRSATDMPMIAEHFRPSSHRIRFGEAWYPIDQTKDE